MQLFLSCMAIPICKAQLTVQSSRILCMGRVVEPMQCETRLLSRTAVPAQREHAKLHAGGITLRRRVNESRMDAFELVPCAFVLCGLNVRVFLEGEVAAVGG